MRPVQNLKAYSYARKKPQQQAQKKFQKGETQMKGYLPLFRSHLSRLRHRRFEQLPPVQENRQTDHLNRF